MSLSAAAIRMLANKGLSASDIADVAEANEPARSSGAIRQKRYRDNKRDVTRDVTPPPNERDNLTPSVQVSEPSGSSPSPRAWSLPAGVSLQVWQDFLSNRKRKRLGNTETAWKGFCDDLKRVSAQTGIPPPELIRLCAAKGWGSINDPTDGKHGQSGNIGSLRGTRPDPALDLLRAARAAEDRENYRGAGSALPAISSGRS